ncbi:MAG: MtrB/PioB family outer membrane beta-barrel protein [Acidobacteria bacterium]|nr:MtrB/PioB family outer membrane beta-barrel protein [Acidobacteriota bacterium]
MRTRLTAVTAALLLASATYAMAQTTPSAPGPITPKWGTIELGGIFGDVSGDEARFERYRDDRNGLFSNVKFNVDTPTYAFDATAYHIGYRDQRYALNYDRSRVKFTFLWDSLPTNLLYGALTPWSRGATRLELDDNAQRDAQNRVASGVPCVYLFPCTNPTAAAVALANPSIYNRLATRFDLENKRDTAAFGLTINATEDVDLHLKFATTKRKGEQPWGASYSFGNANEIPLPIDQRTNDFQAAFEWARPKGMFRVAWDGSWFNNDIKVVEWDNPVRLTDFVSATGSFDNSAYSNSNGPAFGRLAGWPNNTLNVVSVAGMYKMPRRSSFNATLQFSSQDQNDALIPWTTNGPLLNAPGLGLTTLPRSSAEASAKGLNALFNFTSRPVRYFSFNARYRYNDREVTTADFDARSSTRFDGGTANHGHNHLFNVTRKNFDVSGTFTPRGFGAVRVGYGNEQFEREGRGFSDVSENIFRVSYDLITNQYFSARASFDTGKRRGEGFHLQGIDYEVQTAGEQPGLRYYDEADRDRKRGSVVFTVMPTDIVDFYVNVAMGTDKYLADDSIPPGREFFGLMDSDVASYNVGVNVIPNDRVAFGASFGRDSFSALQKARNANPPPDASWTDPNRNWTLDNEDTVNNFNLYLDVAKIAGNADLRLGWDFSDSDQSFAYGGPRPAALQAAGTFIPLPNVTNSWNRLTADVKYFFTSNAGLGVGYFYEKLDIEDWATIDTNGAVLFTPATGEPRLDYLGGLLTGYGNRPYKGSVVHVRLLYLF